MCLSCRGKPVLMMKDSVKLYQTRATPLNARFPVTVIDGSRLEGLPETHLLQREHYIRQSARRDAIVKERRKNDTN